MAAAGYFPIRLGSKWAGFDLVKVDSVQPGCFLRGPIFIFSGCVTTLSPMGNKPDWDLEFATTDVQCAPEEDKDIAFLSPTMMSRYEGINQCGTTMTFKPANNQLTINFAKNTNPMVLHLSGFCGPTKVRERMLDKRDIEITQYGPVEWHRNRNNKEHVPVFQPVEERRPMFFQWGPFVFLQGDLQEATFGTGDQRMGKLPPNARPLREVRCLATLLASPGNDECHQDKTRRIEHSVALTIRPDGAITVQGGKVHAVDKKGKMRIREEKKKGCLCLDGIRFSTVEGVPIDLLPGIAPAGNAKKESGLNKISYLIGEGTVAAKASLVRHEDVVMLEGHLMWGAAKSPNPKQPLARLPQGHWPARREVFFTRGHSDMEERRRVDIDRYGRIFCPEGAGESRLELSGIIFVAAEQTTEIPTPKDPNLDELKLQYHTDEVNLARTTKFEGHDMLEQFVRRNTHNEWHLLEWDLGRHAQRQLQRPCGQVFLRGNKKNCMDLRPDEEKFWNTKGDVLKKLGIHQLHTLLHVSSEMFEHIANAIEMSDIYKQYFRWRREHAEWQLSLRRQRPLPFAELDSMATQIVDEMFTYWDFKAQLQGALQHDFSTPASIRHLFPERKSGRDKMLEKALKTQEEKDKFDEIRNFFHLYETTGSNMTHCSLLGASDMFTSTGKWHFPDSKDVQSQLFENIGWLFPKKLYLYISERQTLRFPFIEDLDIQCRTDWKVMEDGSRPPPPDDLLMNMPQKNPETNQVEGDPGELMRTRAEAIHRIYPHLDQLEVIVYSASGYNKGKDMLKSSFHLVWPQLVVDPDRAPVIRHVTLQLFGERTNQRGSKIGQIAEKLIQLHETNNWELVFDSTTINAKNGLRLPYSDKASSVIASPEEKEMVKNGQLSKNKARKMRVREDRPSKAIGKIRFDFEKDDSGHDVLAKAQWIMDADGQTIAQWIQEGSCRRDPTHFPELTPWQLGPDVLGMLPKKPGESFFCSHEIDGEGNNWRTHKPFPNIRRVQMSTKEFVEHFEEVVSTECEHYTEQGLHDYHARELVKFHIGSWVVQKKDQAIWRSDSAGQWDGGLPGLVLDDYWGRGRINRPVEVVFLEGVGQSKESKIIIDCGIAEVRELFIHMIKPWTMPDDQDLMPLYDVEKMSK